MTNIIDPARLTGTLKTLAQNIAQNEGDKNLLDTDNEISIFSLSAQAMLDSGVASDFTEADLNNILGYNMDGLQEDKNKEYRLEGSSVTQTGGKIETYTGPMGSSKTREYGSDGKLNCVTNYDADKSCYKKITLLDDNSANGYKKVVYENNIPIKYLLYDKNGNENYCIEYDDNGNRIISDDYRDDGTCRVRIYVDNELSEEFRGSVNIDKISEEDL